MPFAIRTVSGLDLSPSSDYEVVSWKMYRAGKKISLHVMGIDTLRSLIGQSFWQAVNGSGDLSVFFRDYKDNFKHKWIVLADFSGTYRRFQVPTSGNVWDIIGYAKVDGRVIPGLYQNLVAPAYWIENDLTGEVTILVEQFREYLLQRLQKERVAFPDSLLISAHPRRQILELIQEVTPGKVITPSLL